MRALEGHETCGPESPNHDCSCHISPPCGTCVECPAWDES